MIIFTYCVKMFLYLGRWIDPGDEDFIPYTVIVSAEDEVQANERLLALVDGDAYKDLRFTLEVRPNDQT